MCSALFRFFFPFSCMYKIEHMLNIKLFISYHFSSSRQQSLCSEATRQSLSLTGCKRTGAAAAFSAVRCVTPAPWLCLGLQ